MGEVIAFPNKRWESYYNGLDKLELLEQMVNFQERRSRMKEFTPEMRQEGIALFSALERTAETPELRIMTANYVKRLMREDR